MKTKGKTKQLKRARQLKHDLSPVVDLMTESINRLNNAKTIDPMSDEEIENLYLKQ